MSGSDKNDTINQQDTTVGVCLMWFYILGFLFFLLLVGIGVYANIIQSHLSSSQQSSGWFTVVEVYFPVCGGLFAISFALVLLAALKAKLTGTLPKEQTSPQQAPVATQTEPNRMPSEQQVSSQIRSSETPAPTQKGHKENNEEEQAQKAKEEQAQKAEEERISRDSSQRTEAIRVAHEEAERLARERAEAERIAHEQAEADRVARAMAEQGETVRARRQLGNYQVIRLLGRGGFAEVYLGEHIYLQTQAAIKVLSTQLAPDDVEHFQREARTIARLKHAHIVRVLEFGIDGSTPFLVMDYAPGGTLRQRHPRGTRLPLLSIVFYVKQVADALQYAHDHKLIHRDVKPENMLLGDNQEVLLSDFGIAIVAQSSRNDQTMDTTGTIAYMAPEQIQAHPRPASDQYALGVVVYEWLSGDRPFTGSFTEVAAKHILAPPPPLREKLPTISPVLEQVVMTALAKAPQQRFATVQAFATALEQASHDEA